jgi:hypothetical protein
MKKLVLSLLILPIIAVFSAYLPSKAQAAQESPGLIHGFICAGSSMLTITSFNVENTPTDTCIKDRMSEVPQNQFAFIAGRLPPANLQGNVFTPGVLGYQGKAVALLFDNQISSQEYIADILDNIGVPQVSSAYAQGTTGGGTGYNAMKPFLEFWKIFRNSHILLYHYVCGRGIMIMPHQ